MENIPQDQVFDKISPSIASTPPRKRKWLKILLIILVIPFVLLCLREVSYFVLSFAFPDSRSPDDSHLQLQTLHIPKEDNAYYDLLLASSSRPSDDVFFSSTSIEQYFSGQAWDQEEIALAVTSYSLAIEHFRQASKKKYFLDPYYADPSSLTFPEQNYFPFSSIRDVSRMATLDALSSFHSGEVDAAIEKSFDVVRVGALLEGGPQQDATLTYLVGVAVKKMGLLALLQIARDSQVSTTTKARIVRDVALYRDNGDGLRSAFKMEYFSRKYMINATWKTKDGKRLNSYVLRPNTTVGYFMDHSDALIARINISCMQYASVPPQYFLSQSVLPRSVEIFMIPNSLGKAFFDAVSYDYDTLFKKRCEEEAMIDFLATFGN